MNKWNREVQAARITIHVFTGVGKNLLHIFLLYKSPHFRGDGTLFQIRHTQFFILWMVFEWTKNRKKISMQERITSSHTFIALETLPLCMSDSFEATERLGSRMLIVQIMLTCHRLTAFSIFRETFSRCELSPRH